MARQWVFGVLGIFAFFAFGCHDKKRIEAARANAVGYGLAHCDCEKLGKKEPPGDTTLCRQQMAQALRYLNINFEMGKFSEAERLATLKAGEDAFDKCMKE